ncbi:hypothetical protein [Selenomonas sp. AE3005]|uniref:hypothetical protein n=1 Tax=Selenomonas sp. AE3005 TaxID=1485543 RepID=UPI0025EE5503|nr:hypothetical protein [Selenomonas sp. AE3005]
MGKIDITKGQVLHRKGETVTEAAIVLKGSCYVKVNDDTTLTAGNGAILGAFHAPGDKYKYDYIAAEDGTLFVYDYNSEQDLTAAISATPSIAPVMVTASLDLVNSLVNTLSELHDKGCNLCHDIQANYTDYKDICAELMVMPQQFPIVKTLAHPEKPALLSGWQTAICRTCLEKKELLRKSIYPADINFCVGAIMLASQLARLTQPQIEKATAFIQKVQADTDDFTKEYLSQKAKLDGAKRQEAMEAGSGSLPQITNALHTILAFAGTDRETGDAFARDIRQFMKAPDKTEKSDEMRRLRMNITKNFYTIYEAAFLKSLTTSDIPAEVKMFFLFGFVDEELAGAENTAAIYKYTLLWEADPQNRVMTAYDWLHKIYRGEVPPSKDEFENDWPDHLKEEVRQGNLTQAQADAMLDDTKAMALFELSNMVTSANKMTYGSIFSFIPAFYAQSVSRPLEACLASTQRVTAALNRVRDIDFGCFYRPTFATYPEFKINRFEYNLEVLPYIILLPNYGSRGVMWQEIEGRRRTTPAHMVLSIFHSENLDDTMVKMCAQFRWEMCKRIQGVHYSDISEPSLTSEYCNYLQFYKKNATLSEDMKEKVKAALKRNNNSYSNVFAAEYETFINQESEGLPRLNKVSRGILFKYCTFSHRVREAISINPQYRPLLDRWRIQHDEKLRTLELFSRKILTMTETLPEEVKNEIEYLRL